MQEWSILSKHLRRESERTTVKAVMHWETVWTYIYVCVCVCVYVVYEDTNLYNDMGMT